MPRNPEPAHWFADFDPFGAPVTWPAQVQVNNANRFRIDPAYWPEASLNTSLPVKVYRRHVATGAVTLWTNLQVSGTTGGGGLQDFFLNANPGDVGAGYVYERMEVYKADNVTLLYRDYDTPYELSLSHPPLLGSLHVYLNGVEQYEPLDWTLLSTPARVRVNSPMDARTGDLLEARYAHDGSAP